MNKHGKWIRRGAFVAAVVVVLLWLDYLGPRWVARYWAPYGGPGSLQADRVLGKNRLDLPSFQVSPGHYEWTLRWAGAARSECAIAIDARQFAGFDLSAILCELSIVSHSGGKPDNGELPDYVVFWNSAMTEQYWTVLERPDLSETWLVPTGKSPLARAVLRRGVQYKVVVAVNGRAVAKEPVDAEQPLMARIVIW